MNFCEAYTHTCSSVGAAARNGDLMALQQLVWNGRPVDVRDNRGWRPIHDAAANGHPGCLEFLLRQDETDPDWVSFAEETPLLLAARHQHLDCVRVLLSFQADPNITTNEGYSPLWEATSAGSYECSRLLIKRGANTNTKIYTNSTPLHIAVEKNLLNIVEYLLNHGAKIDAFSDHHLSPVFLAAHFGNTDCLRSLLKAAKNRGQLDIVNEAAEDNATPLLIAAQEGHDECVRLLLEGGADANIPVKDLNAVPLQYAIYKGHKGCVNLLLPVTSKFHLYSETYADMHPLVLALKLPNTVILETLLAAGLDPSLSLPFDQEQLTELSPLATDITSTTKGSVLCHIKDDWPTEGVTLLLKAGMSPNSQTDKDLPPLLVMLWNKNFQFFKLLLEHGASPNIYHNNIVGNIAILLALRNDIHKAEIDKCSYECATHLQYIWPLLVASGEARSLFTSPSVEREMETDKISLLHLLKTQEPKWALPIVAFLLFFCHFVDISTDVIDLFEPEDAKLLQRIAVSTKSLAHICRRKIVLRLASCGKFNRRVLDSIALPSTVKDYLRFTEFDALGHFVLDTESEADHESIDISQ